MRAGMAAVTDEPAAPPTAPASSASAPSRWPARPAPPRCATTTRRLARQERRPGGLRTTACSSPSRPIDDPRYALSVIVQHGGWAARTAAAPRAREIMRMALLKDPELRPASSSRCRCPRCRRRRAGHGAGAAAAARRADPTAAPAAAAARPRMTATALTRPGERDRLVVKLAEIDWRFVGLLCADRRRRRR